MSTHDMNIANQGFPAFRSDLNNALAALASNSLSATAPSTTYAGQTWFDTTANLLKLRNKDNDAWVTLAYVDPTNDEWELRSAVIQAVDSAGISLKTDDGTTRFQVADDGVITFNGAYGFPTADGSSGQVLQTDGSGNLSFVNPAGGKILQVVQSLKTDTLVGTSTSFVAIPGLSASITPSSTSSKILIFANVSVGSNGINGAYAVLRLVRGSTAIGVGDLAGVRTRATLTSGLVVSSSSNTTHKMSHGASTILDSPSTTSATTYAVQIAVPGGTDNYTINRSNSDLNGTYQSRAVSSITLMEVSA